MSRKETAYKKSLGSKAFRNGFDLIIKNKMDKLKMCLPAYLYEESNKIKDEKELIQFIKIRMLWEQKENIDEEQLIPYGVLDYNE